MPSGSAELVGQKTGAKAGQDRVCIQRPYMEVSYIRATFPTTTMSLLFIKIVSTKLLLLSRYARVIIPDRDVTS
jgi:hypothetical protein